MEMSKEFKERLADLAKEPVRFVRSRTPEEQEEYNRTHPLPTHEELVERLRRLGYDPN